MPGTADEQVLTARWVFPATSAPLPGGRVTIRGNRIVSVDPAGDRSADIDFGNAAIIPGLVNAHTHLDLSGMRGVVVPGPDFVGWLRRVVDFRRTRLASNSTKDVHAGLAECLRFGTTLVGDIAAGGSSWETLVRAPLWSLCYREVLGLPCERVHPVWADLVEWMATHPDTPTCRVGVSPHAPYSVHKAIVEAAARIWPICIHLAETEAERELLESQSGPFVSFLNDLGVWDPHGLAPSLDWVTWKASRSPAALLAHGNYLSPATSLAQNTTVVYCPRTHAAFGHPPHPFPELIARGVRVALGTDSLASNPDLDIMAEARFIHDRCPMVPGEQILRMATINGATALGFGEVTGSLEAGKSADLVVVPLSADGTSDPHELLFGTNGRERRTMWRGAWRMS
jgi:cytosine/adenosine deaminase-related metal-dependent hydrolase